MILDTCILNACANYGLFIINVLPYRTCTQTTVCGNEIVYDTEWEPLV